MDLFGSDAPRPAAAEGPVPDSRPLIRHSRSTFSEFPFFPPVIPAQAGIHPLPRRRCAGPTAPRHAPLPAIPVFPPVIPAQAGIHPLPRRRCAGPTTPRHALTPRPNLPPQPDFCQSRTMALGGNRERWIPAYAGMTERAGAEALNAEPLSSKLKWARAPFPPARE